MCLSVCHRRRAENLVGVSVPDDLPINIMFWNHIDCSPVDCPFAGEDEERFLFSVGLEVADSLDAGKGLDLLRQEFRNCQSPLSPTARIETQEVGKRWEVGDNTPFFIVREEQGLSIYAERFPPQWRCASCRHRQADEKCGLTGAPLPDAGACCHYNVELVQGDVCVEAMLGYRGGGASLTDVLASLGVSWRERQDGGAGVYINIEELLRATTLPQTYGTGTDENEILWAIEKDDTEGGAEVVEVDPEVIESFIADLFA